MRILIFFSKKPQILKIQVRFFSTYKCFWNFLPKYSELSYIKLIMTEVSRNLGNIFFRKIPPILKLEVGFFSDRKSFSQIFQNTEDLYAVNFIWQNFEQNQRTFLEPIHHHPPSTTIHHPSVTTNCQGCRGTRGWRRQANGLLLSTLKIRENTWPRLVRNFLTKLFFSTNDPLIQHLLGGKANNEKNISSSLREICNSKIKLYPSITYSSHTKKNLRIKKPRFLKFKKLSYCRYKTERDSKGTT